VATLEPFTSAPGLQAVLRAVSADPVIALLLGAVIAWAAHSSVAVVLLVAVVAQQGIVPLETAFALVLGANVGSSLNPLLASREVAGRRVALGNLLVRLVGCAVALPVLSWLAASLAPTAIASRDVVADFHVLFNLALSAAGLPLLRPLAALVRRLLPDRAASPTEPPLHMDDGLAETPSIALGLAARHALRMADRLEMMLADSSRLLSGDETGQERIRLAEREIDARGADIQRFLARLDPEALGEAEHRRLAALMSFTVQIGHAADVLARNVAGQIGRRRKQAGRPQPAADADLTQMLDRLAVNLRTAASLLVTEDEVLARRLADEKHGFRSLEERRIASHVASLRSDPALDTAVYAADLDLLRDMKRINDHLVASAAYPILRMRGELLDSRLKSAG
jgi:phosphate:Na+ symporter